MKWTLVPLVASSLALGGCGGTSGPGGPPGEAGRPPADVRTTPFKPALPVSFTRIELGYHHTCGLAADGRNYCMGDNADGQLGTSAPMQRCKGGAYPCSPTQLGDGLRVGSPVPVRVATAQRFRAISHGNAAYNTCAIGTDGQGHCWGIGQDGQNGNGTRDAALTPTPIAVNLPMQAIGVGQGFGCALTESGEIYCWGQNTYGKLGTGVSGASLVPALVAGDRRYSALAVGGQHACALDTDGLAWCWGFAASVGSSAPVQGARVPQAVDGARRYVAISAGFMHTCALDDDRAAWCWGNNLGGAIGDGTLVDRVSPVPVAGGLRYQQLSAGGVATCGIATDGALACWGSNPYGQIGFAPGDP